MNDAARQARGEILLFLHADVRLQPGALSRLAEAMQNRLVVGGNFEIEYEGGDRVARAFGWINRQRQRFGIFYGDSGIFCRRAVFDTLGGYREWPILEDYEFARRLSKEGGILHLREKIQVSDRRWRRTGVWATMWAWFWIQALYLAGVSPRRLAWMYRQIR